MPSADMLNGNFNFFDASGKQVGNTIYDPTTIRQLANGSWTADPFPGNIIPKDRFDTVANNFLSHNPFTPADTTPGFVDKLGAASEPGGADQVPLVSHAVRYQDRPPVSTPTTRSSRGTRRPITRRSGTAGSTRQTGGSSTRTPFSFRSISRMRWCPTRIRSRRH